MTCSEYWPMLRNSHLGAMVIVRREGFSNDQWLLEGVNLLDLKYTRRGLFRGRPVAAGAAEQLPRRAAPPDRQIAAALPRNDFDYVWLIDVPPYNPQLVAECRWSGADRGQSSIGLHQ